MDEYPQWFDNWFDNWFEELAHTLGIERDEGHILEPAKKIAWAAYRMGLDDPGGT